MTKTDPKEIVLATIPGENDQERLVFCTSPGPEGKPIQLRRESYSSAVGWFVQSSIDLSRNEMVALRSAMGGSTPRPCQSTMLRATNSTSPATISFEASRDKVATA